MLCEVCKKDKAYVARTVKTSFGEEKIALCNLCATKFDSNEDNYNNTSFLQMEFFEPEIKFEKCPICGTSLNQIKKTLYVGCYNCYNVFEAEIKALAYKFYGKNVHVGKVPLKEVRRQDKLASTSASLLMARAVEEDDIELAKEARRHFPIRKGDYNLWYKN